MRTVVFLLALPPRVRQCPPADLDKRPCSYSTGQEYLRTFSVVHTRTVPGSSAAAKQQDSLTTLLFHALDMPQ